MSNMRPGYTAGALTLLSLILGGIFVLTIWFGHGPASAAAALPPKAQPVTPYDTPVCGVAWNIVPSPNNGPGYNSLGAVAAASASDIWAVGYYTPTQSDLRLTQIQHWDGAQWGLASSPSDGALYGVAVVSSSDVWAVGYIGSTPGPYQTVIEHWNGAQWSIAPSPNPGSLGGQLNGVAVVSANDVWAVGFYVDNNASLTLTLHWDGAQWTQIPSPNAAINTELYGVTAISTDDVWAVGAYVNSTRRYVPVTERWDGTQWNVVTPNASQQGYLFTVAAIASNDVWAVGYAVNAGAFQTLAEHWDGTQWSVSTTPNPGLAYNFLYGVSAVSSNDVWAVGLGSGTLALHWDGTQWTQVTSPNADGGGELTGLLALSSANVWAVGDYYSNSGTYETLIERYADPCVTSTPTATRTSTPTLTPTATPARVVVGHVSWQGRPAPPNALYVLPITMSLKSGALEVNYPVQNTDTSGFFTVSVSGLPSGIYNWRAKSPKFLANSGAVPVPLQVGRLKVAGYRLKIANSQSSIFNLQSSTSQPSTLNLQPSTSVEMGLMRAGDCNNDNTVNIADFNTMKLTFGKSVGDPGYDDRADFTGDQIVNIFDFNLQKINFGQGGAPPIGPGGR